MNKPDRSLFRGYWNLDEASGNAIDSTANGNTLTETSGTIESAEGGRDFEAGDTEYFTKADNADLSFADEVFTIGCWVKLESKTGDRNLITKYNYGADKREYGLQYDTDTDRFRIRISPTGTNTNIADLYAGSEGAVSTGTKYFVLTWHDPVANKVYIQIDNGTVDDVSHTYGCSDNDSPFILGADWNDGTPNGLMDGIMWSAFVYAGVMTADERTWMYNGGTPRKWNELGILGVKTINGFDINNLKTINGKSIQYINSINNAS